VVGLPGSTSSSETSGQLLFSSFFLLTQIEYSIVKRIQNTTNPAETTQPE
jgi:hypothetical protein